MTFISFSFIAFFVVVLVGLRLAPGRAARQWLLLFGSLSFYASWKPAYLLVLSWADYSYVQPVSSAISYPLIALLAEFILHESVSPIRWAGVAVICLGVFVVGRTQVKTTGAAV